MKRTKEQKAITLIALIITIVVLMVLAAVAISSIQNDGIIGHAQNATNKYTEEQQKEQDMLNYYELVLSGKAWVQNKTTVTRGDVTLKVGEKVILKKTGDTSGVAYSDSIATGATGDYTGDWVVLGVEHGKLLLVSASNVVSSVKLGGTKKGDFAGAVGGYYDGVAALHTICSAYLNETYADSARSITVEDINRVTGYNPEKTGDGNPYGNGEVYQYGNEVTYTMNSGKVAYSSDVKSATTSSYSKFITIDNKTLGTDVVKVTSTAYMYYPETLTNSADSLKQGISNSSAAYTALFSNTSTGNGSYWVASTCSYAGEGYASMGLRTVYSGIIYNHSMWSSIVGLGVCDTRGARAVVSINPDIEVEKAA